MLGTVWSDTVTVNEQVLELFEASTILNTMVVTPSGKLEPDGGPPILNVLVPEQLSEPFVPG